ncbi:hypothetical protein Ahy_A03g011154 [Arachis hypogaea]|uniref:Uncharacterized protein n=1 Tax=Arachis hypogaea TaxID=3818 RepID=A0A445DPS4_ARAHY|nr:hypothetical protein Ahy_A03g011154 [Arachis hypogaea]
MPHGIMRKHVGKLKYSMTTTRVLEKPPTELQIGIVKKVRKYPNFRQCEAVVYFKSKCDLVLNRSFISRALAYARAINSLNVEFFYER